MAGKMRYLEKILDSLGWEFKVPGKNYILFEGDKLRFDGYIEAEGDEYIALIKHINKFNTLISTVLYRSIVKVNSLSRISEKEPILIFIISEIISHKELRALERMFNKYAPAISLILINNDRNYAYRISGQSFSVKGFAEGNLKNLEFSNTHNFAFTDLELLMFKILFYNNHCCLGSSISNAFTLSKIAVVNRNTANDWVNTMINNEFILKKRGKPLRLINLEDYLNLWTGRYNIYDQEHYYFRYIREDKDLFTRVIDKLKNLSFKPVKYFATGHLGSMIYNLRISTGKTIHLYTLIFNPRILKDDLNLIVSEKRTSIVVLVPKFSRAFKEGLKFSKYGYAVDPVQLYLDCFHLKERGIEQAERIFQELISNE